MSPPAIQRVPWPQSANGEEEAEDQAQHHSWLLESPEFTWLVDPDGILCLLSLVDLA
jgi:hypothetical protein